MRPPIYVILGLDSGCCYCKEELCQCVMGPQLVGWMYRAVWIPPRGASVGCFLRWRLALRRASRWLRGSACLKG